MDVLCSLADMNMHFVGRKVLEMLPGQDLLKCREVSRLWRHFVDEEVIGHWSEAEQVNWRWTFCPMKVTQLDIEENLDLEDCPRKVQLQKVLPAGEYIAMLFTEFERDDDTLLVFKGSSGNFLASVPVPKADHGIKDGNTWMLWWYTVARVVTMTGNEDEQLILIFGEKMFRSLDRWGKTVWSPPLADKEIGRLWSFTCSKNFAFKYTTQVHIEERTKYAMIFSRPFYIVSYFLLQKL